MSDFSKTPTSTSKRNPKPKRQKLTDIPEEQRHNYVEIAGKVHHRGALSPTVLEKIDSGNLKLTIMPLTVVNNHNDGTVINTANTTPKTFDIKPNKGTLRSEPDA